jgi:hypothetical protein
VTAERTGGDAVVTRVADRPGARLCVVGLDAVWNRRRQAEGGVSRNGQTGVFADPVPLAAGFVEEVARSLP